MPFKSRISPQVAIIVLMVFSQHCLLLSPRSVAVAQEENNEAATVRFATFNISFNRDKEGLLEKRLAAGKGKNFERIALTIQTVRPDVLLLNEFDSAEQGEGVDSFLKKFLARKIGDPEPIEYPYVFSRAVNTGVDSGLDLNQDGKTGTADDAYGYGKFPGQYAMVILSKYPIKTDEARTFQKFLWKDMPDALLPVDPSSDQAYYSPAAVDAFRLSSKSHWDVPIDVNGTVIHFLTSHPTPPTFDGPEDKNGCRNHDEIRMFADYVGGKADYLYDDAGKKGGLADGEHFVIAGDLNADPIDGDSHDEAINQLLSHSSINAREAPKSAGGAAFAELQGGKNGDHVGDPANDTADFGDRSVGNLRIDYVLPAKSLEVKSQAIFWPHPDDLQADWVKATDHRMVYVDLVLPK